MSIEIAWITTPVSQIDQARYGGEPGWIDAMRARAAQMLAHLILRDGKALYRRIDPPEDEFNTPIKHQWAVAFESNLDEIAAREKQMEDARRQGRAEAASICLRVAQRYRNISDSSGCKGVIADALEDAAKEIRRT